MKYFCKHDWGKWSKSIENHAGHHYQTRYCLKCHKIKQRKISKYNGIHHNEMNNCFVDGKRD